jgi:hypothetical protein
MMFLVRLRPLLHVQQPAAVWLLILCSNIRVQLQRSPASAQLQHAALLQQELPHTLPTYLYLYC